MLVWEILLAIVGLVLLFAEIMLPGFGVFGVSGVICLLVSTVLVGFHYGTAAFLIMLVCLVAVFILMIVFAKRSGLYQKVVLKDKQEAKDFDEELKGFLQKEGVALTPLHPVGRAAFDGSEVEVTSQDTYIEQGAKVKVTGISGKTLVVRQIEIQQ